MPARKDAKTRAAVQHWSASRAAESRYALDVSQIMSAAHKGVLQVVEREHLGPHEDAPPTPAGLGAGLLKKLVTWQKPRVQTAFDRMAKATDAKVSATAKLYGIRVRKAPGVDAAIAKARQENVDLIANATSDFLDQVRETLEDHEGETADEIREALEDRVGVSVSRGMVIARDQTTKLNGAINEHRQRSAGVTKFRWSTSEDERVRKDVEWSASDGREGTAAHEELDGEIFDWDDPPTLDGEVSTPGSPILCRCVSVPVIEDDEESEEGEDEPDDLAAE